MNEVQMNRTQFLLSISFILNFLLTGCLATSTNPSTTMDPSERAKQIYQRLEAAGFLNPPEGSTASEIAAFGNMAVQVEDALKKLGESQTKEEETEAEENLSHVLRNTGYLAEVIFRTKRDGARVKYQLITDEDVKSIPRLTNASFPYKLPIGTYRFWTEREGVPTSSKLKLFIVGLRETVEFEEK